MYCSAFVVIAFVASFIPNVGTSCEGVNSCASEVVSVYAKSNGTWDVRNYNILAPSCAVISNLTAKASSDSQFCYQLLTLLTTNSPCSNNTTTTIVTGSGSTDESPHEEEETTTESENSSNNAEHGHHEEEGKRLLGAELRIWGFTICSVLGISVAGFACVLILPSMCTVCYNHFQQFLVAMAVGTLSGDAVLHLIPHSFFDKHGGEGKATEGGEHGEDDGDQKLVLKGVILLFGLFLLYTIEQLFAIVPVYMAARRAKLAKRESATTRARLESTDSKHSKTIRFASEHGHSHDHPRISVKHDDCLYRASVGGGTYDEQLDPLVCHEHCPTSSSIHHFQSGVAYSTSCEEVVFRLHGHTRLLDQKECSVVTPCTLPCVSDTPCTETPVTTHAHHQEISKTASCMQKKCSAATDIAPIPGGHHHQHNYKHGTVLHRCHSADNISVYCTQVCLIPIDQALQPAAAAVNGLASPVISHALNPSALPNILEPANEQRDNATVEEQPEKPEQITKYPVESAISIMTAATDIADHSTHGHGHSHTHGHSHSHSHFGDVNSRAWMVILADAFHNMVDGMAIGVAFSASLAGGFSTAIAVAMHELPHELGDFAVLLKEGLSIKRGLMFNCVSSVICLIGAIIGVGFGSNENFDQLIFALAAGVFLYVSLVDMLPQISSVETSASESVFLHLIIRCGGMLSGTGIMICVAMLESRIGAFLKELV